MFLSPDSPNSANGFGQSIAVLGDTVLIADPFTTGGGKVYQFNANTGSLVKTITNPTPFEGDRFGWSIATYNGDILIGAPFDGSVPNQAPRHYGAAYLFDGATGGLKQTFIAPGSRSSIDQFGWSVTAVDGAVVIGSEYRGAAMYNPTNGNLIRNFPNPSTQSSSFYGEQVFGVGNSVLIAAPQEPEGNLDDGRVYRFNIQNGSLERVYDEAVGAGGNRFGHAMTAVNGKVLIGDPHSYDSGSAYLYDIATGALLRTFPKQNPSERTFYGESVALVGSLAVVSAVSFQDPGAAYVFNIDSGTLALTIREPLGRDEGFGDAMATLGGDLLVGSPSQGSGAGAVYLFEVVAVPEPSSFVLSGIGTVVIILAFGRHRRAACC